MIDASLLMGLVVFLLAMGWYPCCCETTPPETVTCEELCIGDEASYYMTVEIPALVDYGTCTDCEIFAGTYILEHSSIFGYDCFWKTELPNPSTCDSLYGGNQNITVWFGMTFSGGTQYIGAGLDYTDGYVIASWIKNMETTDPMDCEFESETMACQNSVRCSCSGTQAKVTHGALT